MDKYEYKISVEEIKRLIKEGNYAEAVEIADTIDWRRVKSVMMLCTISDLYKINRRYEDARDVLLLAYEHRPGGRTICYSLCELCLKTDQFVPAMEYFKEFVQIAPNDPGRYILQYKIYQAQEVSLEERIQILEELKKKDYREKWAYELAYLYHLNGDATKCVSECDELILWFGEGKYVLKAMELKMQHQPLTEEQQYRYDHRFDEAEKKAKAVQKEITADDVLVQTVDVSQYNTMNLQAELAAGLKEVLEAENQAKEEQPEAVNEVVETPVEADAPVEAAEVYEAEEAPIVEAPVVEEPIMEEPVVEETTTWEAVKAVPPTTKEMPPIEEYGFEAGEDRSTKIWGREEIAHKLEELKATSDRAREEVSEESRNNPETNALEAMQEELEAFKQAARENMVVDAMQKDVLLAQPPQGMADVLSQESDGQISIVVPESEKVEKQITGQISIDEVLADWELKKKRSQEMHEEEIRKRVLQDTGEMFTEFEQAVKDGLLEKLEKGEYPEELVTEEVLPEEPEEETTEVEEAMEEYEEIQEEASEEFEEVVEEPIEEVEETVEEPVEESQETEVEEVVAEESVEEDAEEDASVDEVTSEEITEEVSEDTQEKEPVEEQTTEDTQDTSEEPEDEAEEETEESDVSEDAVEEESPEVPGERTLTKEEKELFEPFIQTKSSKQQLLKVLDTISIASYTGNVVITGVANLDALSLAKALIKDVQAMDSNFTGESAKISGETLNKKNVAETIDKFKNGALIIEKASGLSDVTVNKLYQCLQKEEAGIIVIMLDTRKKMNQFLESHEQLASLFNARMNLEAMSNDALANFGKRYAREKEYAVDDNLGMLALHTRIEEMQSGDHAVTILDVKGIVDDAIHHVNRKTVGHFFDVLFGRRYDDDDMIILGEKDFVKKR